MSEITCEKFIEEINRDGFLKMKLESNDLECYFSEHDEGKWITATFTDNSQSLSGTTVLCILKITKDILNLPCYIEISDNHVCVKVFDISNEIIEE